ncbi:MAG: Hsp70 family protein, partial [Anaerolineae bacterium]|nr:Hsp70 family protein [Anaerolineae bacterium]
RATGRSQKVTITATTNLSKNDVERLVREADSHRSADEKQKELVEARNQLDSAIYQVEKLMKDGGDRVPGNIRADAESAIQAGRDAMNGSEIGPVRAAIDRLQQVANTLAMSTSTPQGAPSGAPGATPGGQPHQGGDDVVEGEFREA